MKDSSETRFLCSIKSLLIDRDQKHHKKSIRSIRRAFAWSQATAAPITSANKIKHSAYEVLRLFRHTHVHKNEQQQTESSREYLDDAEATSSGASFFTQLSNQLGFRLNYLPWELKKTAAKKYNMKLLDWKQLHLGNFHIWK